MKLDEHEVNVSVEALYGSASSRPPSPPRPWSMPIAHGPTWMRVFILLFVNWKLRENAGGLFISLQLDRC